MLRLQTLNDDCLIKIFRYLSLNDLVRIVDYDDRFSVPARFVFSRRFGRKRLGIDKFWYQKSDTIKARTLRMLNHFGDLLTFISVSYSDLVEPNQALANAFITKCRPSLLRIELSGIFEAEPHQLLGVFENVEAVSFIEGEWCVLMSQFNVTFPNAKSLHIRNIKMSDSQTTELLRQSYPSLEHFSLLERDGPYVDIHDLAAMNPQIRTLSLSNCGMRRVDWSTLLQTFETRLPQLQTFEMVELSYWTNYNWLASVAIAYNENGKSVSIYNADESITTLIKLVIQWPDLKQLMFPYKNLDFESVDILNDVLNCDSLEKLSICYRYPTTSTIFSGNWQMVKATLDTVVEANGNKWTTQVVFEMKTYHRLSYLIYFVRV